MSELGLYAIRLALMTSAVGVAAGIYAGLRQREDWGRVAERSVNIPLTRTG